MRAYVDDLFLPGQIWRLKGGDAGTTVIVLKTELTPNGAPVVHVAVRGVDLEIQHLPFTRRAMLKGVDSVVDVTTLPPYSEGYALWHQALLDGHATAFDESPAEVIDRILQATP